MDTVSHTLAGGRRITLEIRRTAKTNIILRPAGAGRLRLSIPPHLSARRLAQWLSANDSVLVRMLAHAADRPAGILPEKLWWQGRLLETVVQPGAAVGIENGRITVPEMPDAGRQKQLIAEFYRRQAEAVLLPRLWFWSRHTGLVPAAAGLTGAKTFWGVCRRRTGIRLNWRLAGAPEYVADYVCIHELCHLQHPNHSPAFWQAVRAWDADEEAARAWLKRHGAELFAVG